MPLPPDVIDELRREALKLEAEYAAIFGSSLTHGLEAKDVDILVVAKCFRGVPGHLRRRLLSIAPSYHLDAWLLTPEEFTARQTTEIVRAATAPKVLILVAN